MLETKCKTCLDCNRLEMPDFKEVYRCENYMRGAKDEQIQKQKDNSR